MHRHNCALLGTALLAFAACAGAQKYPDKPLRIIVMNTPGSGADIVARTVTPRLTEVFGQQFIVDNRAGAGGRVGHAGFRPEAAQIGQPA